MISRASPPSKSLCPQPLRDGAAALVLAAGAVALFISAL